MKEFRVELIKVIHTPYVVWISAENYEQASARAEDLCDGIMFDGDFHDLILHSIKEMPSQEP